MSSAFSWQNYISIVNFPRHVLSSDGIAFFVGMKGEHFHSWALHHIPSAGDTVAGVVLVRTRSGACPMPGLEDSAW